MLTFGILGLVFCALFGVAAWVMGNTDIQKMNQGIMDQSGRGSTEAGRICGIVGTILGGLAVVGILVWFVFLVPVAVSMR